jgi:hypothetical protein
MGDRGSTAFRPTVRMAATGLRPIALGLGVWFAVAVSSLAVQYLTGQL